MNRRARRNLALAVFFSMWITIMCRCSAGPGQVVYQNGLTCDAIQQWGVPGPLDHYSAFECRFTCPDGKTVLHEFQVDDPNKISQSDINLYCGVAPVPTTTITVTADASVVDAPVVVATVSPTASSIPAPILPLLTSQTTSCNLTSNNISSGWVNFRLAEPPLDLTGKSLEVTIGGKSSACGINKGNISLLSCFLPVGTVFPAGVAVKIDGVEVNNFTINLNKELCAVPTASATKVDNAPATTSPDVLPPPTDPGLPPTGAP